MENERIDLLDRKAFIEGVLNLVQQLSEYKKGSCFSIEGSWGIGKTFVIEELERILEKSDEDRYFVFHYNCWKYDYYEEPAVAITSAMIASIQEDNKAINVDLENAVKAGYKFVGKKLKEIAGAYIENRIGVNIVGWVDDIKDIKENDENTLYEFDKLFSFSQTIEKVRKNLQEIAKKRTIVLIVDELDRCVPQYAIKVLERLHHIFYGLENVEVIMAIDRAQLEHSVEEMFGSKKDDRSIDIEKYLKKFIDFSMVLDMGMINQSFMEKYKFYFDRFIIQDESNDLNKLNEMLPILFKNIDIRSQEKIVEKANTIHSLACVERVDISVAAFEMMFETLKICRFGNMKNVVLVNNSRNTNEEKNIGKEKISFLKSMEEQAWDGTVRFVGTNANGEKKRIIFNLYGKVFWYFSNIFNKENVPYVLRDKKDEQIAKNLEIAQKYWQFSKIIK